MEKLNALSDQTIRIVAKSQVKDNRILRDGKKTWVAIDPFPHHRGRKVEWQIADPTPHTLEINPPDAIIPESLKINGNHASADIYAGAQTGYQEYTIYVDGEFVYGGSAPGIIIE